MSKVNEQNDVFLDRISILAEHLYANSKRSSAKNVKLVGKVILFREFSPTNYNAF
jgi:hypothetical protein